MTSEAQITYLKSLQAYQEYLYEFNRPYSLNIINTEIETLIGVAKHRNIDTIILKDIYISLENEMESIITERELLSFEQFTRDNKLDQLL